MKNLIKRATMHFGIKSMREHFASDMAGYQWESDGASWKWWDHFYYGVLTIRDILYMRWTATVCEFKGHDWQIESCDPENGREEFECQRCHLSHTAQF